MKKLILALLLLPTLVYAGHDQGGGGDPCEDRIQEIRNDIKLWISKGGSKDLKLPSSIDLDQYNKGMAAAFENTKIACVKPNDKDYPITVDGTPKVCRFDKSWRNNKITCDYNAFLNKASMDESTQYQLIHHEYAGIAGLESPSGDVSQYFISNQISAYLVDKVVKRLAVKSVSNNDSTQDWINLDGKEGADTAKALQDAVAYTKFKDCTAKVNEINRLILYSPEGLPMPEQCGDGAYYLNTFNFNFASTAKLSDVPVGEFKCSTDTDKSNDTVRRLMKSSNDKSTFLQVVGGDIDHLPDEPHSAFVYYQIKYELNPDQTKLKKITFNRYKKVNVNTGTIGNPNWVNKDILSITDTCNAAN